MDGRIGAQRFAGTPGPRCSRFLPWSGMPWPAVELWGTMHIRGAAQKLKKRYTAACARSSYVGAVSVRVNLVGMRCSLHVHMRTGYERYADVRLTVWVARRRA